MRRILHIVVAAALVAMCVYPAAGQGYRKNKVKNDPEPLEIHRSYCIPEKTRSQIWDYFSLWGDTLPEVEYHSSSFNNEWFTSGEYKRTYFGRFENLDFGRKRGTLSLIIDLVIFPGSVDLVFRDIDVDCGYLIYSGPLSKSDDSFNRTPQWLINHKKVFDQARIRANECFEYVAASLEEYIKDGGAMEMKRIR